MHQNSKDRVEEVLKWNISGNMCICVWVFRIHIKGLSISTACLVINISPRLPSVPSLGSQLLQLHN